LSVEPQTNRHLQIAERNRGIAVAYQAKGATDIQPPAYEWVAVMAFYAAVHYVNAYLWEIRRYAPPDHQNRNTLVNGDPALRQCRAEYDRLLNSGFRARYVPGFRLDEQEARDLIDVDLELVRQTVRGALGVSSSS
jgi:hypothetical protein